MRLSSATIILNLFCCIKLSLTWRFSTKFQRDRVLMLSEKYTNPFESSKIFKNIAIGFSSMIVCGSFGFGEPLYIVHAADIPKVELYTKKNNDVQPYADIQRGFKLLRPFGFNEFEGNGEIGYDVKFSSLVDIDTNVVIGSAPAAAGKSSITDFGSLESLGEKFVKKRGGKLISAEARETDGIVFYQYQFENPLDKTLPRPGTRSNPPNYGIELYEVCVNKGKLWSIKALSNDKAFPKVENALRAALASFVPHL